MSLRYTFIRLLALLTLLCSTFPAAGVHSVSAAALPADIPPEESLSSEAQSALNSITTQLNLDATFTALTAANNDFFGNSVAVDTDGNTAVVGAYGVDAKHENQGAAFIFTLTGTTWVPQAFLVADDSVDDDRFGISVAISNDGNTVLIGADQANNNGVANQGAAYIYTRSNNQWTFQSKLSVADGVAEAHLGWSVALSGDGNTCIVGAYQANIEGAGFEDQGAAYIFVRSDGAWVKNTTLNNHTAGDQLGYAVDINDNGSLAIAGSPNHAYYGSPAEGRVTIFSRSMEGAWAASQNLRADDAQANDLFGRSVAISGDGSAILVGASLADVGANLNQGAAYLFAKNSLWTQRQKFTRPDGSANEFLGMSVDLNTSGSIAVVGVPKANFNSIVDNGAALVFRKAGDGTWSSSLIGSPNGAGSQFGNDVTLSADGATILAGASLADTQKNTQQGLVNAYTYLNSTWGLSETIEGLHGSANKTGYSISLSDDGNTALVSLSGATVAGTYRQGAVRVFSHNANQWVLQATLTAPDGAARDSFGSDVALSGSGYTAIVGATGANSGQGAVYIFDRSGSVWNYKSKLTPPGVSDGFGKSVAISDGGSVVLVGAFNEDVNGVSKHGAAYAYHRLNELTWSLDNEIKPALDSFSYFGFSVALSGDGYTALIGTPTATIGGTENQGAVYIYEGNNITWNYKRTITTSDGLAGEGFGWAVDVSDDGSTALIGLPLQDQGTTSNAGGVVVYKRLAGSWDGPAVWVALPGSSSDINFGAAVALSDDASTLLIGAPFSTVGAALKQGKAALFLKSGNTWVKTQEVLAPNGKENDEFGTSVALNADGHIALIDAYQAGSYGVNQGIAYLYSRNYPLYLPVVVR